jgi:hypothetical protein
MQHQRLPPAANSGRPVIEIIYYQAKNLIVFMLLAEVTGNERLHFEHH